MPLSNLYYNDNLYGGYRNKSFADIFSTASEFQQFFANSGITSPLSPDQLKTLYYLLYGEYGNSPIASSDENRFKYKMMNISNTVGPIYFKKMDIQDKLVALTDDQLKRGNTVIHNMSDNPSTEPTTDTIDELTTINQQNVDKTKRGALEGYAALESLLDEDITQRFLSRYKNLFLQVVAPENALWYKTIRPNEPVEGEGE